MKTRNKIYLYSQTTGYKLKTAVLKIILKKKKKKGRDQETKNALS